EVYKALKENRSDDELIKLVDIATAVNTHCAGKFEIRDGVAYVGEEVLPDVLSDKLILFTKEQIDVSPLLSFWNRLSVNPSYNSRNQLYRFIEHCKVPIVKTGEKRNFKDANGAVTEVDCSGFIVLWKAVKNDFKDIYSGKFDNSPGNIVS